MTQKLTELLEKTTPLPWRIRRGDPAAENEVCFVRGVTIFGPRKAVACKDDALLIEHSANVLPELVDAARELTITLAKHNKPKAREQEIQAAWERVVAAISAAEEVKDHSEQLTPTPKPQTVKMS